MVLAAAVHSSGDSLTAMDGSGSSSWMPPPQFGDECSGSSSCCQDSDDECALSCTTLSSKLSSCSAACSSDADCLPFAQRGEELQCIQVAGEEQIEKRDTSFDSAVVIGACAFAVLVVGVCTLVRDKGVKARRDLCAVCL